VDWQAVVGALGGGLLVGSKRAFSLASGGGSSLVVIVEQDGL
jgi:hypothetical protein